MFKVLLESRATRGRPVGSTLASAVAHGALLAGAVALTLPSRGNATATLEPPRSPVTYLSPRAPAPKVARQRPEPRPLPPAPPRIAVPIVELTEVKPVDLGPTLPPEEIRLGGASPRTAEARGAFDSSPLALSGTGEAVDVVAVDRAPRLIGRAEEPAYPPSLRDAGIQGRVVAQFVVDTMGRAELDGLQFIDATYPSFAESVRRVLAHYRFAPGELAGHRVRTRVQIPFAFTLKR
jgi:protein TonB